MSNNVIPFPRGSSDRKRRDLLRGILRCEVSERWLQFPSVSEKFADVEYLHLHIMTRGADERERKLCELVLDKQALVEMLRDLPVNDRTET